MSRWQKYILLGGYAYVAATVWVPTLIDPSFNSTNAFLSATGLTSAPGTATLYLSPYGVDFFYTVTGVLIFALLFRYYRSSKSPLVIGQTKYLIVGILLIFAGGYALNIARYYGGVNLGFIPASAGVFVLLLGLRKKGFYSVTPSTEVATSATTIRYPLEDGHSYLVHEPRAGFEAFSGIVRSGHQGLLVTRTYPADVRKDYDMQTTPMLWLAESKGDGVIPPGDLLGLSLTVKDFLEKATKPVVMLHGIEYLTTYNGFTPILKLINGLSESNAERRGILILPVLAGSLNKQDEILLASETTPMPMPAGS
jgi:hypothetical protein